MDFGACDGERAVNIRFFFSSDSSIVADGWYIDDCKVSTVSTSYTGTEYRFLQGTSMAAPHVAGVAGLLWSYNSGLGYREVKNAILDSADKLDSLNGKVLTGGRINAYKALLEIWKETKPMTMLWLNLLLSD